MAGPAVNRLAGSAAQAGARRRTQAGARRRHTVREPTSNGSASTQFAPQGAAAGLPRRSPRSSATCGTCSWPVTRNTPARPMHSGRGTQRKLSDLPV